MTLLKNGAWLAVVQMTIDSGIYDNVLMVQAPHDSDATDVAHDVGHAYTDDTSFPAFQVDALQYTSVTVTPLDGESAGVVFTGDVFDVTNGSRNADMVAPQVAAVMTKRTDVGGPRGRGRMYIPGATSEGLNDHETGWKSDSLAGMQACGGAFLSLLETGDVTTGLLIPNGTSNNPLIVGTVQMQAYLGTVRRRAYQYR